MTIDQETVIREIIARMEYHRAPCDPHRFPMDDELPEACGRLFCLLHQQLSPDYHDSWGTARSWESGIAEALHELYVDVPGYNRNPDHELNEDEDAEAWIILEWFDDGLITLEDVKEAVPAVSELVEAVRAKGWDY
jgi:hypothetical protein